MRTYNLFISHSWAYCNQYNALCQLLSERPYFRWRNYSVPKDDPIHNASTDTLLRQAIERQMKNASVVVILAGVYSTYSKWINIEIELAKRLGKPIVAVEYWASKHTSTIVKYNARKIVKWNTESIVAAIRELA